MVGELLSSFVGEAIELGSPTPDQRIALLTARTDDYFAWVLRTRGTPWPRLRILDARAPPSRSSPQANL